MPKVKTGVIKSSTILRSPGRQLRARYYLDPTADIDEEIRRRKVAIANSQRALERLERERDRIIAERSALSDDTEES